MSSSDRQHMLAGGQHLVTTTYGATRPPRLHRQRWRPALAMFQIAATKIEAAHECPALTEGWRPWDAAMFARPMNAMVVMFLPDVVAPWTAYFPNLVPGVDGTRMISWCLRGF